MKYRDLHSPAQHRRRRAKRIKWAAIIVLCVFMGSQMRFQAQCAGVRKSVLRLHVIANSDSKADQAAKLYVRDQLLLKGADLFDGSIDVASAEAILTPQIPQLEACAKKALRDRGLSYSVKVTIGEAYFNTRTYKEAGVTLPAGRYRAVRVILGAGEGKNWWCVMFPPLCLPAARPQAALDAVLTAGQLQLIKSNPKYEIRFKVVELWECCLEKLRSGNATS